MSRSISITTAIVVLVAYGIWYFSKKRNETKDLPQPGNRSFIWGNMRIGGECMEAFPPNAHMHAWPRYLQKKYNLGDFFYLDLWPVGPRFLFLSDPALISQYVTTAQCLPKSSLETEFLDRFLGAGNMVSAEGQRWKSLRSMFNPGFSPNHLMTLVPYIVDTSMVFYDLMAQKARSGELFQMENYTVKMTIDIIGKIVLDSDFDSQKAVHPIVQTFRERVRIMPTTMSMYPWDGMSLTRPLRLWLNARKLNSLISDELDEKIKSRAARTAQGPKSIKERKKSVVELALDAYEKENGVAPKDLGAKLDTNTRKGIIDSMKTFIFAGHDTTATTIAYIYYLLYLHPPVFQKLSAELDAIFGAGTSTPTIANMIREDPYLINKLEYGNAIIKETLRLFPAASTMRYVPNTTDPAKQVFVTDPSTGKKLPLHGWHVWPSVYLVGRNETYFPQPTHFIPERFIAAQTPFPEAKLFSAEGKEAWRPFERGPRNCIGQELAMIESRAILALVVRDFEFFPEYDGKIIAEWKPVELADEASDGRSGAERQTMEGHACYPILSGSAKPKGGMPGRIRFRKGEK